MKKLQARQLADGSGWHYTSGDIPIGRCSRHEPHATAEEAEACYKNYLIEERLVFNNSNSSMHRCRVCEEFTTGIAEIGEYMWFAVLCENHQNKESVENLLKIGTAWIS